MPAARGKGSSIQAHPMVEALNPDPSKPPVRTVKLFGFPCNSPTANQTRLWLDSELTSYVDIPNDAILYAKELPDEGGSVVWVEADAELSYGSVSSHTAQAGFLTGAITSAHLGPAAAGGAGVGPLPPQPIVTGPSACACPSHATPCVSLPVCPSEAMLPSHCTLCPSQVCPSHPPCPSVPCPSHTTPCLSHVPCPSVPCPSHTIPCVSQTPCPSVPCPSHTTPCLSHTTPCISHVPCPSVPCPSHTTPCLSLTTPCRSVGTLCPTIEAFCPTRTTCVSGAIPCPSDAACPSGACPSIACGFGPGGPGQVA
jgi:hypothetical protein